MEQFDQFSQYGAAKRPIARGEAARGMAGFRRRIGRKLAAVAPIVVGALLLMGGAAALTYLIEPHLPLAYRDLLDEISAGDWTASRDRLLRLFDGNGPTPIVAFLGIQILQVLVAPIPGQLVGLLGGYLFGFSHGLLLTMTGLTIGSAIAMSSSRLLGATLVRRFVPAAVLAKWDHLIDAGGTWNFFMIFLLPVFPDDAVCFLAGLTRLPLPRLLLVCVLGRLPGMAVLTFVGANVGSNALYANVVLGVAMLAACALWLYSDEIEAVFARFSRRVAGE